MSNNDAYLRELAMEIAEALHDLDALPYHMMLVKKYNEEFLRNTLTKVLSMPDEKIKTTRAKLYTWLVNQSNHGRNSNSRN